MRYGSVCSGIEAATVAWHPLGWRASWLSEIEPFPCSVLAHHYPDVPNLGDMTRFQEWPDDAIDLLVGGTPCQSYSIGGLRAGLADPRGSLMLTYLAIAPVGWSGRMSLAFCPQTEDTILPPSSGAWGSSGMGTPTECWTLSSPEWLSSAGVSSLLDILETGDVPHRYYLSPTALRGVKSRNERRSCRFVSQRAGRALSMTEKRTLLTTLASDT
jgi:hypothetical protein